MLAYPHLQFSTQYGNFGAAKNKGYEIDFGWNAIKARFKSKHYS